MNGSVRPAGKLDPRLRWQACLFDAVADAGAGKQCGASVLRNR